MDTATITNGLTAQLPLLRETVALRHQIMEGLTDADLAYRLPGDNLTLGALCREMGQVERAYIDSFRTFSMNYNYAPTDPALETSVEKLRAWFGQLEAEFEAALSGLSEDDIQNRTIDRGGFAPLVTVQFHIYREALLIYAAKASLYLRALGKPLSEQMAMWIG
jgi:hypothetical protein